MVTVAGGKATDIRQSTINGILAQTGSLPFDAAVNLLVNGSGVTDGTETVYRGIHGDTGLTTGDINSRMYQLVVNKADDSHVVLKVVGLNRLHTSTKNIVQTKVPTLVNRGAGACMLIMPRMTMYIMGKRPMRILIRLLFMLVFTLAWDAKWDGSRGTKSLIMGSCFTPIPVLRISV